VYGTVCRPEDDDNVIERCSSVLRSTDHARPEAACHVMCSAGSLVMSRVEAREEAREEAGVPAAIVFQAYAPPGVRVPA
jgi:hypothetical protein